MLEDRSEASCFNEIEVLRSKLKCNDQEITVTDFGTGISGPRKISSIVAKAEKNARLAQLLFRLVQHFKPQIILDIGTSFGITTSYLASAAQQAKVITMEGCPETMNIARSTFKNLQLSNLQLIQGDFDQTLEPTVNTLERLDFVFFDGNHRLKPTLRYFQLCKQKAHNNSVFVFDDINWSPEMRQAWEKIKQDPEVTVTIDLFHMGIVFFRKEQAKENFTLRF